MNDNAPHTARGTADGELETYTASLRFRFGQMAAVAATMTDDELNRAPAAEGGNSIYALAAHTAGNARAWVLGIACGQPLRRDRPAEFASSGDSASLQSLLLGTLDEITSALAALPQERLDERVLPSREHWGLREPHEISRRYAVLQVIEHASLHLGHMELTRDLLRTAP